MTDDDVFDRLLADYGAAGGRIEGPGGNPTVARRRFHEAVRCGFDPADLLARARRFTATFSAGELRFLPGLGRLLDWRNGYLDLDAIGARERRQRRGGR